MECSTKCLKLLPSLQDDVKNELRNHGIKIYSKTVAAAPMTSTTETDDTISFASTVGRTRNKMKANKLKMARDAKTKTKNLEDSKLIAKTVHTVIFDVCVSTSELKEPMATDSKVKSETKKRKSSPTEDDSGEGENENQKGILVSAPSKKKSKNDSTLIQSVNNLIGNVVIQGKDGKLQIEGDLDDVISFQLPITQDIVVDYFRIAVLFQIQKDVPKMFDLISPDSIMYVRPEKQRKAVEAIKHRISSSVALNKILFQSPDHTDWDPYDPQVLTVSVFISFGKLQPGTGSVDMLYLRFQNTKFNLNIDGIPLIEIAEDEDIDIINYSQNDQLRSPGGPELSNKELALDSKRLIMKAKALCTSLQTNSHIDNNFFNGITDVMEENLVRHFALNSVAKTVFREINDPSEYMTGIITLPIGILPNFNSELWKSKFMNGPYSPFRERYPLSADGNYQQHPLDAANGPRDIGNSSNSTAIDRLVTAFAGHITNTPSREVGNKYVFFSRDNVQNSAVIVDSPTLTITDCLLKMKNGDRESLKVLSQN